MKTFVRPMPMTASDFHDAERATAYLKIPRNEAISLKLRPVMWDDTHKELWNAYVYPAEYAQAHKVIGGRKLLDIGMGDRATLLSDAGQSVLLIEHETGPELILLAKLALATASIGLAKEAFSFFKELLKTINDANEKRKKAKEPTGDRYYAADGVTLELRLKGSPKLLSGLTLPAVDEKVFDQFLMEGLDRARQETEWQGFERPE